MSDKRILFIFTRTPLHVGAGSSVGAIDQPVQRERHTGFPIIPGSSVKGVLRDHLGSLEPGSLDTYFGRGGDGQEFSAGSISFGEARLVLFPVRSARGAFAFATSPLALRRLVRDMGLDMEVPEVSEDMTCLAGNNMTFSNEKAVVLEEYRFQVSGSFPEDWESYFRKLMGDAVLEGAGGKFVLLSDSDFSHFAVNACQVNQHVRIDHETGTAQDGGLFNEETVPSEALFYSPLHQLRAASGENLVFEKLSAEQMIQFGGNGTTGLGFCTTLLVKTIL